MADFNARIIEEFRANGGRVGGDFAEFTLLLLHHVGATSGIRRVSPVGCSTQGDGRFAIIASNGGSARHPGWYHNLKANPRTTVELGTETFAVHAEEVAGEAHTELWGRLVEEFPHIADFPARTARRIPLFVLTRQD
ncbi:nitroreductase family deazaflavin-dependent oxidoreductase [Longispora urticae]